MESPASCRAFCFLCARGFNAAKIFTSASRCAMRSAGRGWLPILERKTRRVTEACAVSGCAELEILTFRSTAAKKIVSFLRRRTVTFAASSQSDSARRVSALCSPLQVRRNFTHCIAAAAGKKLREKFVARAEKALLSSKRLPGLPARLQLQGSGVSHSSFEAGVLLSQERDRTRECGSRIRS
jgi:hypothetical protein